MDLPFIAQYAEARGYAGLARAGRAFAAGPTAQTAWTLGGQVVGVLGPDKFINAAIRYTSHLITRAGEIDQAAAEEIVALAQSRAPRRTGRLAAGIKARQVGRSWAVGVEAEAASDGENYGSFVEWGTAPGYRGRRVAGASYFAGARAGRRSSDGHPGTPPHPFFVPAYGEVLAQRGIALEGISDDAAAGEDLL